MKANKLSILICSLNNRQDFLEELLSCLLPQLTDEVQIIINSDGGKKSVGQKRNELLMGASGEYIAFIDDDDLVSPDYIPLVLEATKTNCDVVGIHLLMTYDKNPNTECRTYHSLEYRSWWDEDDPDRQDRRRYFRNPNHLNPVKREFALATKFPETSHGEDHDYSKRLLPLLNTEYNITKPIYYYQVRTNK